jgi:hypothetical protein
VYGINIFKTSTEDELIVVCGDKVQKLPITGGDPVDLSTSYPASGFTTTRTGAVCQFVHINGMLYIVNGTDENVKYNGTALFRMGVVAPTTLGAPSLAAGSITGTRLYKATLVSSSATGSVESEPTSVRSVIYAAEDGTFSAPTVPGTDPQVTHWNLYGTAVGGSAYFRINTTPVLLASTIVDNLTDALVTAGTPIPTLGINAVPPGKFKLLTAHQGRLVGVVPSSNVLYWSDIGLDTAGLYPKPENWAASNALKFPDSGGTSITAIVSFYEWVVVFQQFGVWSVRGDLTDTEDRRIAPLMVAADYSGLGVANQGCVVIMDNRVLFAAKDRVYEIVRDLNPSQPDLVIRPVSQDIDRLYQQLDFTQGAVSCPDRDNKRWIFVGKGKVTT